MRKTLTYLTLLLFGVTLRAAASTRRNDDSGDIVASHLAVALGNGCSPQQPIDAPIRPTP